MWCNIHLLLCSLQLSLLFLTCNVLFLFVVFLTAFYRFTDATPYVSNPNLHTTVLTAAH